MSVVYLAIAILGGLWLLVMGLWAYALAKVS